MKGKSAVDTAKKADNKLGTKRKASGRDRISKKPAKKGKDPNKPKRPPSAFFVFLEEFRQQFKEKFPNNKSVAAVGKAAGDKWKTMTDAEKAPYVSTAAKRKTEYEKNLAAYNKKQSGGSEDPYEESDKSKSEVSNEEGDNGDEEEDD